MARATQIRSRIDRDSCIAELGGFECKYPVLPPQSCMDRSDFFRRLVRRTPYRNAVRVFRVGPERHPSHRALRLWVVPIDILGNPAEHDLVAVDRFTSIRCRHSESLHLQRNSLIYSTIFCHNKLTLPTVVNFKCYGGSRDVMLKHNSAAAIWNNSRWRRQVVL